MKPHYILHLTRRGQSPLYHGAARMWWVSLQAPHDHGYTVAATRNYRTPAEAVANAPKPTEEAWAL